MTGHIQKCSLFTDESTAIKVTFFSLPVFFYVMSSNVAQHDNVWLLYRASNVPLFRSEKGKLSRLTLTSKALIFERAFYFSSGIYVLVIYLATQIRQAEALKWVIKIIFIERLHFKKKSWHKIPAHRRRAEGRWCWQELMETEKDRSEWTIQIHET